MTIIEKLNRIQQIDQLIRLEATGTPSCLASRLCISESQLRRYIEEMRDMGAKIMYNSHKKTYEYKIPVKFKYGFIELKNNTIFGGFCCHAQKKKEYRNTFEL